MLPWAFLNVVLADICTHFCCKRAWEWDCSVTSMCMLIIMDVVFQCASTNFNLTDVWKFWLLHICMNSGVLSSYSQSSFYTLSSKNKIKIPFNFSLSTWEWTVVYCVSLISHLDIIKMSLIFNAFTSFPIVFPVFFLLIFR